MNEDENSVAVRIGASLARLRVSCGLTQQQFAERTGIDRTYVAYLERAERLPSFGMLARFARVLGVDVAEFFGEPPDLDDEELQALGQFRALTPDMRQRALSLMAVLAPSQTRERVPKTAASPNRSKATATAKSKPKSKTKRRDGR